MEKRKYGENITMATKSLSNEEVPRSLRYSQIIQILQESARPLSAKEIAVKMYEKGLIPTSERNFTAPRLTELSIKGVVEPVGKDICKYSGKKVCFYELREGE